LNPPLRYTTAVKWAIKSLQQKFSLFLNTPCRSTIRHGHVCLCIWSSTHTTWHECICGWLSGHTRWHSTSVTSTLYIQRWRVYFWLILNYSHAECTEYNYLIHFHTVEYTHLHHLYCNPSPLLRLPSHPPRQGILMQASENTDSCMNFMVLWGVMLCILAHRYVHFRETCCFCLHGNQASHHRKGHLSHWPLGKLKSQIMIYFRKYITQFTKNILRNLWLSKWWWWSLESSTNT
jgi:hypothetical protein